MTVPRLPIIADAIARNVSGLNVDMDRLSPSHVPQNTPVISPESRMLINCQICSAWTDLMAMRSRMPDMKARSLCPTDCMIPP